MKNLENLDWQPLDTAPYGETVWVRNHMMDAPVKATRGWAENGTVNGNDKLFTSKTTVHNGEHYMAPGRLVCPTEWAKVS